MTMTGIKMSVKKGAELLIFIAILALGKTASGQCTSVIGYNSNPTGCGEWVAFFVNTSPPADSIVFDFGDGTTFTTNGISADNYYDAGYYLVQTTAYHTNGCISTDFVGLTIGGLEVTTGDDTVACQTDLHLYAYTAGGSGNYQYSWSPGNALSDSTVQSPFVEAIVTDQDFTVTVTDLLNGCQASSTINVTHNDALIDTLDLCNGAAVIDLGPGAMSYEWLSFTDEFGNNQPLTYPNTVQSITVNTPGTYFMYAVFPECGALTSLVEVEACAQAPCSNIFTYNYINGPCAAEEIQFVGSANNQVVDWLWDFGDGATSTSQFPNHVFDQGVWEITLTTVDINGCMAVSTQWLTTNGGFGVVAINDSTFCQQNGHLGAQVYGGSTQFTYQWSPATGLSDPTILTPQVTSVDNQMYTITVTDQQTGCTAVDSTFITVQTPIFGTYSLCDGPVFIDLGPGANAYYWQNFTDTSGVNSNLNYPTTTQAIWADQPGEYFMYADFPECGALTSLVTVEACPDSCTSFFTYNPPVGCGGLVSFFGGTSTATDSVTYDFGDGTQFTTNGISAQNVYLPGVYTVTMTAYHIDGCVSSSYQVLTIGGGLDMNIWPSGPAVACAGDIFLSSSVTNGSGNYAYQWFSTGTLNDPTVANPILEEVTQPTDVYLYLTDIATGCQVADTVTFYPDLPSFESIQLCADSVYLYAPPFSMSYAWTFEDPQGNISTINNPSNILWADEIGMYTCWTYTSGCGQVLHEFEVVPCQGSCAVFFTHTETPQGCGSVVDFILNYTPPLDSILVEFGDGAIETFLATNISHYYQWGGSYTVNMIGHHIDGCTSTQSVVIDVQGGFTAEIIPDGITCGGDIPLSAQITGGSGSYSYWWFSSSSSISDPQIANPILSEITEETQIILNIVDQINACQYNDTVTLYPNIPVVQTQYLCNGFAVLEAPNGSEMYQWSFEHPSGTITTLPETGPIITVTEVGVYTCITYTSGCATVLHEFTVVPCSGPCTSFFSYNMIPSGCGALVDLVPGYTPDIDSIIYYMGDGSVEVSYGNSIQHYYPTGSYTVQMVAYHIDGCISQSAQVVHVTTGMDVEIINDSVACGGDIYLAAFVNGGSGGYMYEWFADGLPFTGSTSQSPVLPAISQTVEISVFVTDSAGNCAVSDTTHIFPNLPLNETYEMCTGTVWLQVPPFSEMYSWTFEDLQGNVSTLPGTDNFYGANNLGTYTCVTYSQGCQTVTHTFEVVDCTTGCFAQISSNLTYDGCGAWIDFILNGTPTIDSVLWDLGNGQTMVDQGQGPNVYYPSGDYIATAEVFFDNGCSYTTSYGIILLTEVTTNIWEDTIACNGGLPLGVDVTGGGGQYEFMWSPAAMMDDPTAQYPYMTVNQSGLVTVEVVDTYTGCTVYDSVMVYANEPLNEVVELCQGSAILSLDPGSLIYQWTFTDLNGNTTQLPNTTNEIIATELGTYACFTYYSGCNTITHLFTVVDCGNANDDVWPGDANSDNIVTAADALWVGLGYGQNGPVRPAATLNWVGQPASDWLFNFSANNVNLKHADCDGNGVINFDDTLAINLNYGFTHNKIEAELAGGEPELWIEAIPDTAGLDQAIDVYVHLAKLDNIVDSIHGLSFTIAWDEWLTQIADVSLDYDNSIFGTPGTDMLTFQKAFLQDGRIDLATTRLNGVNIDGFGEVVHMRIVTIDNLSGMEHLPFWLENVTAITSSEDPVALTLGADTVVIDPNFTTIIDPDPQHALTMFPNPTKGEVTIANAEDITSIEVLDGLGRVVLRTTNNGSSVVRMNLYSLASGLYRVRAFGKNTLLHSGLKISQ